MNGKLWIVRVVRKFWYRTDYVGCYLADTAAQALTLAGVDRYMAKVMNRQVVRVEAVAADDLELVAVRVRKGLRIVG